MFLTSRLVSCAIGFDTGSQLQPSSAEAAASAQTSARGPGMARKWNASAEAASRCCSILVFYAGLATIVLTTGQLDFADGRACFRIRILQSSVQALSPLNAER